MTQVRDETKTGTDEGGNYSQLPLCRALEIVSSLVRVRNSGSLFQSNIYNSIILGI